MSAGGVVSLAGGAVSQPLNRSRAVRVRINRLKTKCFMGALLFFFCMDIHLYYSRKMLPFFANV